MSTDRKIFSGFAGGIGLSLVNICISFFQFRILLHFLPEPTVGLWLLFTSIGAYVLLLDLGLSPTLGREISFAAGRNDIEAPERLRAVGTLIRSCTRVAFFLSIVVYLIGAIAGWAYLKTVVPEAAYGRLHVPWLIFVAGASLNLVGEGWFAGIYGMGEVLTEKLIRSGSALFGFLMMLTTVMMGWGIEGLAISWLIQSVVTICAARYFLGRITQGVHSLGEVDFAVVRRMAVPALQYAVTLLGGILILQTDNLVIASTLGPGSIPNYQAISKLVTILMSLSMTLVVTASPFMSHAHAQDNPSEIWRLLERNQRFSLSVLIIPGACLACFADRIVHLWLGPNHFVGFGVVWVLLAIMCLEAHHLAMATATMATGKMAFIWPALIAGVINIVFSIFLARRFGVLGVALGTLLAQMLTNNWYVPYYALRQFRVPFAQHLRRVILPTLLVLAVTLAVGWIARVATRNLSDITSLLAGCTVAAGIGGSLFFYLILSAEEQRALLNRFRAIRPGREVLPLP